jgi:hypothetical protein
MSANHILIAIDDSEASERAVQYVAQIMRGQAHFPDHVVQTQIATPASRPRLETHILDAAKMHDCGTIVVSREASSGLWEWVQSHVADKLVQADHGHAIWVVAG